MSKERMHSFLDELEQLLTKYDAALIRSGTDRGEFVACIANDDGSYTQFQFREEISAGIMGSDFYTVIPPEIFPGTKGALNDLSLKD